MDINTNYLKGISNQQLEQLLELNRIAVLASIQKGNERAMAIHKILKERKQNG